MNAAISHAVLYNGSTGGIGRHMAAALLGHRVIGTTLAARLEDAAGSERELAAIEPPAAATVIHLAAKVSVPACEQDPEGAWKINVGGSEALLDRVIPWAHRRGIELRLIYVGTGHVYAASTERSRIREDAPVAPRSVYASTKLEAEGVFRERAGAAGIPLTVARVFGLIGPAQPQQYVLPGLITRVREGRLEGIPGLDVTRDYLDARDVCRDLVALALASPPDPGRPEIVNVCSGEGTTIRQLLLAVLVASGDERAVDHAASATAAPGRPDDVQWLVGDPSVFVARTALQPRAIPVETTARDAFLNSSR